MADTETINTELPKTLVITGETVDNTLPIEEGDEPKEKVETIKSEDIDEDIKQEKTKRQSRLDRRFKELTSKARSAGNDAQAWRETLAEVTGKEPPNRADYEDQNDYFSAIEDYRESIRGPKTMLKQAEREEQKAHTELQTTLMEKWDDKVAEISDEFPDFQKIVSNTDLPISTTLQNAILKHKEGPRIVYYLATHPETAKELVYLPIEEQILELSEIASKKVRVGRNVASTEDEETTPLAPPPSKRLAGDTTPRKKSPGEMSLSEYAAWRKAGGGN